MDDDDDDDDSDPDSIGKSIKNVESKSFAPSIENDIRSKSRKSSKKKSN